MGDRVASRTAGRLTCRALGYRCLTLLLQDRQNPRLQRLWQLDLTKLRPHAAQQALLELEFPRTAGADLEVLLHQRRFLGRQLAIEIIVESAERFLAGVATEVTHAPPSRSVNAVTIPDSSARHHSAFCNILRPRCSRDLTVPT